MRQLGADDTDSGDVAATSLSAPGGGPDEPVAALAALLIPARGEPSVVTLEPHPALTAEAEAIVGSIAFGPEDLA